ncbi:MAG: hypothetical protein IKU86_08160 [Thermoguttaceae bacterium]|nr:hypothetical protein [Thermoguttaceae bacterium]
MTTRRAAGEKMGSEKQARGEVCAPILAGSTLSAVGALDGTVQKTPT